MYVDLYNLCLCEVRVRGLVSMNFLSTLNYLYSHTSHVSFLFFFLILFKYSFQIDIRLTERLVTERILVLKYICPIVFGSQNSLFVHKWWSTVSFSLVS